MQFQEDLHIFLKDFGESLVITLSDSTKLDKDCFGNPLLGIFDDSYFNADIGSTMIQSDTPKLTVVDDDIKLVKSHNKVTFNNNTYDISDIAPDGTGMSVLTLEKV